jgi:hypothetical protein
LKTEEQQVIQQPSDVQHLLEDEAYLLESRGVIRLRGAKAVPVLQTLVASSLADVAKRPVLTCVLDEEGYIVADLFVVSHEGDLLVDCEKQFVSALLELLSPTCEELGVSANNVSDRWRVFAELPDQSTFEDGIPYIKYADPRWHMGHRVLRPASSPRSSRWGSELKWSGHAFKLGFLPGASLVRNLPVDPLEAGLHAMGVLDPQRLTRNLRAALGNPREKILRRILPMRVEPDSLSFATMTGSPVLAGDTVIATVIGHIGLYALALTEIAPWRATLQAGQSLRCAGQTVLITWPSWLAQESRGRGGPVALADQSQGL